jgi:hypothetical protein
MGNILQRVGGSLGSAIMVITLARVTPQLAGFQAAHAILAATAVVALASAVALAVSERRAHPGPAGQRTPDAAQSSSPHRWCSCDVQLLRTVEAVTQALERFAGRCRRGKRSAPNPSRSCQDRFHADQVAGRHL